MRRRRVFDAVLGAERCVARERQLPGGGQHHPDRHRKQKQTEGECQATVQGKGEGEVHEEVQDEDQEARYARQETGQAQQEEWSMIVGARGIRRGVVGCSSVFAVMVAMTCLVLGGSAAARPSSHPFEIEPGSFHMMSSSGQAGAHADWTVSFDFAHEGENGPIYNDGRTTIVNLPPGFIGNSTAVPTCTAAQLEHKTIGFGHAKCPPASQVGTISVEVRLANVEPEEVMVPLYNMEVTSFGVTAELGFNITGVVVQELQVSVRPGDSGITVTAPNVQQFGEFRKVSVTTWGLPASHVHDPQRGLRNLGALPRRARAAAKRLIFP